jgi:hypothetical protein
LWPGFSILETLKMNLPESLAVTLHAPSLSLLEPIFGLEVLHADSGFSVDDRREIFRSAALGAGVPADVVALQLALVFPSAWMGLSRLVAGVLDAISVPFFFAGLSLLWLYLEGAIYPDWRLVTAIEEDGRTRSVTRQGEGR